MRLEHGMDPSMLSYFRRFAEPVVRRGMVPYWRLTRGLTLGVRAVVLNAAGEVFLVEHSYTAGWHLPGGGVEAGETTGAALARELVEEGNILVRGTPRLHGVFLNAKMARRDHVVVYVVEDFSQERAPVPDAEIIAHGFFAPTALPAATTRGTRARLAEVLHGAPISAEW